MTHSQSDPMTTGPAELFGESRDHLAARIWELMDARQQAAVLWDMPGPKKESFLLALRLAKYACFCCDESGRPLMAAWLSPSAPHARTAACHFAAAGSLPMSERLLAGRRFLGQASEFADLLIALLPMPWIGAIRYARALGFARVCMLPKCCHLAERGRNVDGIFMTCKPERFNGRTSPF